MTMVFRLSNIRLQDLLTQRWGARGHAPSFCFFPHFLQPLFFFFFFTIPLKNSNTIKTYLIRNHLLFGRELLCYSNTTSALVRNLTILSNTADKINIISNHF